MKTLSREGIQRMVDGQGASSGGGGGIQSLAGYATQAWTEENYLSKPYFNQLFTIHTQTTTTVVDDQGEPVGDPVISYGTLAPNILPGTTETTDEETGYVTTVTTVITSIEAKFGFWSQSFISALGQGSGGGGGATALTDLVDVAISSVENGQVLMYDSTLSKWVNGTVQPGGATTLTALTDVAISSVQNDQVLTYNSTSGKWVNGGDNYMSRESTENAYDTTKGLKIITISNDTTLIGKTAWGSLIQWGNSNETPGTADDRTWYNQLIGLTNDHLYFRTRTNGGNWTTLHQIAYTTDNVASATKLATARTLWGQSFDGTANVSGNMDGVGYLKANDFIDVTKSTSSNCSVSVNNINGGVSLLTATNRGLYDITALNWIVGSNGTNSFLMIGKVGIGTTTPSVKLDVNGAVKATRFYLYKPNSDDTDAVYFQRDTNGNVQLVGAGLWTNSFISALGQGSGGGGGTTALTDLVDVTINNPTDGQALVYNANAGKWVNSSIQGGSTAWGDIINKPTTLNGYGITDAKIANGVITLGSNSITPLTASDHPSRSYTFTSNVEYTAKWHRLGNYKTAGDASNFAIMLYTGSGYNANASQNSFARIVVKDGWQQTPAATNSVGVTLERFGNFDSSHEIKAVVVATSDREGALWVYLPWTYTTGNYTISGVYDTWTHNSGYTDDTTTEPTSNQRDTGYFDIVYNKTYPQFSNLRLRNGTDNYGSYLYFGDGSNAFICEPTDDSLQYKVGTNKAHVFTVGNSNKAEVNSSGLTVNGNLTMAGYIDGATNIELKPSTNSAGNGGYIDFHYNQSSSDYTSRIIEDASGRLYLVASNGIRIGDCVITWDATNNAMKVQKADGTAANLYATGGVSALGLSSGSGGSIGNLRVTGTLNIGSSYTSLYCDSNNRLYVDAPRICFGSTLYMGSNNIRTESGNIYTEEGNIYLGGGYIYLDSSRYIYLDGSTLKFYDGSTAKTIYTY